MNPVQLIAKKRDGGEMTAEEVHGLVRGFVSGEVADYQMSAWAMAVLCRGMTTEETAALTDAMLQSGVTFQWPAGEVPKADKHSTGGIGDKVSLPLCAALACCGVQNPMISGRGLGATGGTLDKLESIPGFRTDLSIEEAQEIIRRVGCVICSASKDLAPADRELYLLRDVSGTVPSIPLITASIMSKKLAEGLDALVLDVKWGSGAFMKTLPEAQELARSLVDTGKRMGVATAALVTDMNQPLGRMAGNANEVDESLDCLFGSGPDDLRQLTVALGGEALVQAGVVETAKDGETQIARSLDDGSALSKFREMVVAQGGDLDATRPQYDQTIIEATASGFVSAVDTELLGWAVIALGGGRQKKTDRIDHSVGIEMLVRVGEKVEPGQPLVRQFLPTSDQTGTRAERAEQMIRDAVRISESETSPPELIVDRVI